MIKNLTGIISFCFLLVLNMTGQIRTPAPSPVASFSQDLGLIEVTIDYSRPGVKGRTIFAEDGLVPFGKLWRTGANSATKITFSGDVTLEGQPLKAGSYAILTRPGATSWDVNFYAFEGAGFGGYVEKEPTLSVTVTPETLPISLHNFTVVLHNLTDNGADLQFVWDNTIVSVKLEVDTEAAVMASIDKTLAGPTNNDYYAAASFYMNSGKDLNKALEWCQKATKSDNPRFWQVRTESLILAELGRKADAIEAAKKSLELAKEAGNDDYVRMNEKSIKEWSM